MTDVVDPPDFEEIIQQQKSFEKDRCIPFVDFPEDDIDVCALHRQRRTIEPIRVEPGYV